MTEATMPDLNLATNPDLQKASAEIEIDMRSRGDRHLKTFMEGALLKAGIDILSTKLSEHERSLMLSMVTSAFWVGHKHGAHDMMDQVDKAHSMIAVIIGNATATKSDPEAESPTPPTVQ